MSTSGAAHVRTWVEGLGAALAPYVLTTQANAVYLQDSCSARGGEEGEEGRVCEEGEEGEEGLLAVLHWRWERCNVHLEQCGVPSEQCGVQMDLCNVLLLTSNCRPGRASSTVLATRRE